MTWRAIAQRITTGEFIDQNLELKSPTSTRALSAPGGIGGRIEPALLHDKAADGRPIIEAWSTALYVVEDDVIRGGGIVKSHPDDQGVRTIDAPGFSTYPVGQPYLGNYQPEDWEDPVDVYRNLWAHLASFPDGDVGLQIVGPSTYMHLSDGAGPYNFLEADQRDVGQELDNVLAAAGLEYVEEHTWSNASMTGINHTLRLGFPRLGRRRTDLKFVQDENVSAIGTVNADGDRFSNDVTMLGNGEGYAQVRARSAVRDGRLRRAVVVTDKRMTAGLANRRAEAERLSRGMHFDIDQFVIRDHSHARIAAIAPGDDVLLEYDLPHWGAGMVWLRVLAIEERGDEPGLATLTVMRSDAFTYASPANPNPTGEPYVVNV